MAILGSRSSYVWFLRSCRGRKTREKEFGRIWSQRGGKTAGGTRLGLGIGTKLGCRDDWRDVSRNLAPVSLPRSGAGKGVESGRGSALGGQERGVGGAHRGAGLHGGRGQVTEGGTNLRWARPAGPRCGALPGIPGRGRRPPRRPQSPRGRKPPGAAPLAAAAAMKAVVQRVTRASVTGQSGGAGRSRPDPAPGCPCQGFSRAPPPGDPSPAAPSTPTAPPSPGPRRSPRAAGSPLRDAVTVVFSGACFCSERGWPHPRASPGPPFRGVLLGCAWGGVSGARSSSPAAPLGVCAFLSPHTRPGFSPCPGLPGAGRPARCALLTGVRRGWF